MSFAHPKTIANDLFDRLEQLFLTDKEPDAFTSRLMFKEADALQSIEPDSASMVKAGIAAANWDHEKAAYWIDNALRLDRGTQTLQNAALTFKQLNQFDLSCECALQALALAPTVKELVNDAISCLIYTGRFNEASEHFRMATQENITLEKDIFDPADFVQVMKKLGLSEQRLCFELKAAYSALSQNNRRSRQLIATVSHDPDGGASLLLSIGFFGNLTDEMKIEADLAQALGEEPGWNPCVLATELNYLAQDAHQHA